MSKVFTTFILFFFLCTGVLKAQESSRIETVLSLGLSDAVKIFDAYNASLGNTVGFLATDGWHQTAQPLKKGRLNFRLVYTMLFYPSYAQTYSIDALGLDNADVVAGDGLAPTAVGERGDLSLLRNRNTGELVYLPRGLGLFYEQYALVPMVFPQLSVGLLRNTELSVRFLPNILPIASNWVSGIDDNDDRPGRMYYWGVGLMHDLKQWIPAIALSPFSLSVWGNYSNARLYNPIEISNLPNDPENQAFDYTFSAYSVGLVASKRVSLFTFLGGVQYDHSLMNARLVGRYLIEGSPVDDPISRSYQGQRVAFNLGAKIRLNKWFFGINSTLSQYSTVSFSLGFGANNP